MISLPKLSIDPNQRDWLLWGTLSLLIAYGMIMFFSVSLYVSEEATNGNPYRAALKQFSILWVGLIFFVVASYIPTTVWEKNRMLLALSVVVMLVLVLLIGKEVNGSKRWITIGNLTFQASEYAKLIYIVYLAGYINKFQQEIAEKPFTVFLVFFLPTGIICSLLILEPDLGNTIEIIFFTLGLTFIAGAHLLGLSILLIGMLLFSIFAIKLLLSPYQQERLLEFTDPWDNPWGADYNIGQSLMSIGRGDITGVGLGNSIHKLGYIPEVQNDFIISVLVEELGLIGLLLLLILFGIIMYRLYKLGQTALQRKKVFGSMVVFGVMLWIFFQMFLNIGGTINLTPIKGLVLPFFSGGGSFILMFFLALGLVFRIEKEVRIDSKS
jgi:cell division protein FtsW